MRTGDNNALYIGVIRSPLTIITLRISAKRSEPPQPLKANVVNYLVVVRSCSRRSKNGVAAFPPPIWRTVRSNFTPAGLPAGALLRLFQFTRALLAVSMTGRLACTPYRCISLRQSV